MSSVLLAFAFLTRLPVPGVRREHGEDLSRALPHFPLVGLVLGALLALAAQALAPLERPLVAGVVLAALLALVSGGLHLDGVADWFDAVGGGRGDRARMLAIMRDPHVGAHGVAALCLVLVAKVALFGEVTAPAAWVALPAVSRASVLPLLVWFPAAREDGLARSFGSSRAWPLLLGAVAWLAVPAWFVRSETLAFATAAAFVAAIGVGLWARARLGGVTGDVCGAAIELAEVAFALAWVVSAGR